MIGIRREKPRLQDLHKSLPSMVVGRWWERVEGKVKLRREGSKAHPGL